MAALMRWVYGRFNFGFSVSIFQNCSAINSNTIVRNETMKVLLKNVGPLTLIQEYTFFMPTFLGKSAPRENA